MLIEDLISTGGSSLKAVEALQQAGADVLGLAAIFTYGFSKAEKAFEAAKCSYFTLSNYETLVQKALDNDYIKEKEKATLLKWYQNPEGWKGV